MKVYISGGIEGVPDYLDNFMRGCQWCIGHGHHAVNPCELDHPEAATYGEFMRADIRALIECEAIYMLIGWQKSRGARLEHDVAIACGLDLIYE